MADLDLITRVKAAIAEITDPQISVAQADIGNCDREPIHIPAAIQPHGVLLVLREADWQILQVSQNTQEHLGRPPEALIGHCLSDILTDDQMQSIAQCLQTEFESVNPLQFEIAATGGGKAHGSQFSAVVHRSEQATILELEPTARQQAVNFFDFYSLVKRPVGAIQQTRTLEELLQVAVETVRQISGFDRVMVYQFDAEGAGSVVAEVARDGLPPYLGLRYPASDIPKQAKYLYLLNLLRLIPDVDYEPVPVIPAANPETGQPVDMSLASLRSVSSLHKEYLHNMGVQASMSISLVQNQQLWGLIACHHLAPRKLSHERRAVCEFLGQIVSLELANRQSAEDAEYRIAIQAIQASFVDILTQSKTPKDALTQNPEPILALVNAAGAAFVEQDEVTPLGNTPAEEEIQALVNWLKDKFKQDVVYHTSRLSQEYPPAAPFSQLASGLLAIAISPVQQIYVVWFRPEVVQTVSWAGNPNKPVEVDDTGGVRLSPRKSFETWKETVRRRSLPWKKYEIEAALELRSTVIGLVLQKADELAELNSELTRSNNELDAFAYIASHDLKEPLRGIHNYSSFLIEDYEDRLGEDGTDKLQTLMRLTQRMEDLIDSLMHYSRLGRIELRMTTIDLQALVEGVIEVIKISKPEAADFRFPQPLPQIRGDRTQITELYTNLISNALKYNDKPEKWLEIGALAAAEAKETLSRPFKVEIAPDTTVFYVRDNGIGIRQKHLENIFKIFKRLHPPKRFGGGTGAGLTIVRKIVERHQGEIWVESVYGEETTFFFTFGSQLSDPGALSLHTGR